MKDRIPDYAALHPGYKTTANGEGSGVFAPNPSFQQDAFSSKTLSQKYQPACKPGSVGHRSLAQAIRDGHSSGTMLAHGLEQPTRTASLTSPCGVIAFANGPRCRPYSVLLPVWFAMPFPLPDTRCALTAPFHPYRAEAPKGEGGRFVLCGTFPGVAPAGRYPAPYVDGARTFLPRSLSTIAGAAVRPTDAIRMRAHARRVKGSRWLIPAGGHNFDIRIAAAFDIEIVD